MNTAVALTMLALAAAGVTLLAMRRLFGDDEGQRNELADQVATLRAMVLQLRYELAEAQRGNEESRVRDLELLRFRRAELLREAEVRVLARSRDDVLSREWEPFPAPAEPDHAAAS